MTSSATRATWKSCAKGAVVRQLRRLYALVITSVNPDESRLLMARFLSEERNEPPDIDVDFEHERRAEVLQYVYNKYGRDRTALAAT